LERLAPLTRPPHRDRGQTTGADDNHSQDFRLELRNLNYLI
jgi:hypothetical protein